MNLEGIWVKNNTETHVLVYRWKDEWRLSSILKSGMTGRGGIGFSSKKELLDHLISLNYDKVVKKEK